MSDKITSSMLTVSRQTLVKRGVKHEQRVTPHLVIPCVLRTPACYTPLRTAYGLIKVNQSQSSPNSNKQFSTKTHIIVTSVVSVLYQIHVEHLFLFNSGWFHKFPSAFILFILVALSSLCSMIMHGVNWLYLMCGNGLP